MNKNEDKTFRSLIYFEKSEFTAKNTEIQTMALGIRLQGIV